MKQDRRLNGWIVISSVIGILSSIVLIACGASLGVLGFGFEDRLAKIKDLQFFVNQKFFTQFRLYPKYLYLFIGIAVGVIGLIILILSLISLVYAQKRKVVRRRIALLIYSLFSVAIVACTAVYLGFEFKTLTDMIKYIAYGIIGVFGFIVLTMWLGVIFGRSEKFMSNDNNKFAYANGDMRNARAQINNQSNNMAQAYPSYQTAPQGRPQNPNMRPNPTARPVQQARPMQNPNMRPVQNPNMQRPMNSNMANPNARPVNPGTRRIVPNTNMPQNSNVRPAQTRPVQQSASRFCSRCGKMLSANETFCSACGAKVNNG